MQEQVEYFGAKYTNQGKEKVEKFQEIHEEFNQSNQVKTEMVRNYNSTLMGVYKDKDKKDRAIKDLVIDFKTRVLIDKLVNSEKITSMKMCISSGKEANVYYAENWRTKEEFAIKIYRVETMVFKDREDYIQGERRFRHGSVSSNPRKLIKLWAEKEFRNLKRIEESGMKCPHAMELRDNLILMEFLGKDSKAYPRLIDVPMGPEEASQVYLDVVKIIRRMYFDCNLVHADLSEYNLLYHEKQVYVIDVSQSVEESHPFSHEFLKRDIINVNNYFRRMKVNVFPCKQVFRYATDNTIPKDMEEQFLENLMEESMEQPEDTEFEVRQFLNMEIPRTLQDMSPDEVEDVQDRFKGSIDALIYAKTTGLIYQTDKLDDIKSSDEDLDEESEEEDQEIEELSEEDEDYEGNCCIDDIQILIDHNQLAADETKFWYKRKAQTNEKDPFDGMTKQERQKLVKEQNKEKRKTKMSKFEKKKLVAKGSGRRK